MAEIPAASLRHQDSLREQLMEAIVRDDVSRIEGLVALGAPLYKHYHHRLLTLESAEPHVRDEALVNPVDWAVLEMRHRAAMQLLELGDGNRSSTEARPRPKVLPEHNMAAETEVAVNKAAHVGHLGLLRMLLQRGASPGQKNREGYTALFMAVQEKQPEAATLLLQYGAWSVEERSAEVIQLAESRGMASVFTEILTGGGATTHGSSRELGDHAAAAPGQALDSPNFSRRRLVVALASSRGQDSEPAAKDLAVNANAPSTRCVAAPENPRGAPTAGARRGEWQKEGPHNGTLQSHVQQASGPREDGIVSWGWSPLNTLPSTHIAAASGGAVGLARPSNVTVTHELSATDAKLRGELASAIRKGQIDILRGLVERGAPLEAAFDLGYGSRGNCLDWACVMQQPEAALVLLELADQQGLADTLAVEARAGFFWSIIQGYLEVLKELLRRGADVGQPSPLRVAGDAESGLSVAVVGSRKEIVLELLRYQAWDLESEAQKAKLLNLASRRRFIAEAFQEANIGDFDKFLAPLDLPHPENGIWEPHYPKPDPTHWESPFRGTADGGA